MKLFHLSIFLSIIILAFSACDRAGNSPIAGEQKRYDLRGKVLSVDRTAGKASIAHEAIPDYMGAMTMDFPIKEAWVWDELTPGVQIRADLVVDNSADPAFWLENISIVAAADLNAPLPETIQPDLIGKQVPDTKLTNQDGRVFSLRDYRGKALAVTFIYSQCPLPAYCIRMSQNFSHLAIQLNGEPELRQKIRLLSISFDPARDTPERLRKYGIGYLGGNDNADFTVWQLAVGEEKDVREVADFFGLLYEVDEEDKAQFNHSLVTAVISPDGIIQKIFSGNRWTSEDLLKDLKAAAANQPQE